MFEICMLTNLLHRRRRDWCRPARPTRAGSERDAADAMNLAFQLVPAAPVLLTFEQRCIRCTRCISSVSILYQQSDSDNYVALCVPAMPDADSLTSMFTDLDLNADQTTQLHVLSPRFCTVDLEQNFL
jgi:hypothetical protein